MVTSFSQGEPDGAAGATVPTFVFHPVVGCRAARLVTDRPAEDSASAVAYQNPAVIPTGNKETHLQMTSRLKYIHHLASLERSTSEAEAKSASSDHPLSSTSHQGSKCGNSTYWLNQAEVHPLRHACLQDWNKTREGSWKGNMTTQLLCFTEEILQVHWENLFIKEP